MRKILSITSLLLILIILHPYQINSCKIQGTQSGVCTYRYLPSFYQDGTRTEREAIDLANLNWANGTEGPCKEGQGDHCMPFCGRYIAHYYPPCVPNEGVALNRDQNFPNGRFLNYNTREKDRWVEEQVLGIIERQVELEGKKKAKKRFYKNKTCQVIFVRYSKRIHQFPLGRSQVSSDFPLPLCQLGCL